MTSSPGDRPREFVEDLGPLRRTVARVRRNAHWIRTQGWGAVAEEHEWAPVRRTSAAVRRAAWRARHGGDAGVARPVLLFGVQRSGTNMLVRGLARRPEVEVHNENDRAAFERYKLRDLATIRTIVEESRHQVVLFKPLCDSHRADEVLDRLGTAVAPRAIWAYRGVDGRVRSSLAKFGDGNRAVLEEFAAGRADGRWQFQRLHPESVELIHRCAPRTLSAESGAALMWYIRNRHFFDLGLDGRDDCALVSYDRFVADPEPVAQRLCSFVGVPYDARLHAGVRGSGADRAPLDLHPLVRSHCDELGAALDQVAAGQRVVVRDD